MNRHHILYIIGIVFAAVSLTACSESSDEEEEFVNWQQTNTAYFDQIYSSALAKANSGDASWKVLLGYQYESTAPISTYNNVVVEVLETGTGSGCPLYTDSVRLNLRGQLLPSTSYPSGFIFLSTYNGDFNAATAATGVYAVAPNTRVTDGLSTALQRMHIGDRWRVYVPYQQGYGTTDQSSTFTVPAYSTLIYDVRLVAYYRAGVEVPDTYAPQATGWVEE